MNRLLLIHYFCNSCIIVYSEFDYWYIYRLAINVAKQLYIKQRQKNYTALLTRTCSKDGIQFPSGVYTDLHIEKWRKERCSFLRWPVYPAAIKDLQSCLISLYIKHAYRRRNRFQSCRNWRKRPVDTKLPN
jgi:hypothetical protein